MRVDSRRAIRLVTHVDLDEATVDAILGEVADVGVPQAVDDQCAREAEGLAVGDEPGVDLRRLHPAAALGHPQRRVVRAAEPGPYVLHVVGDRLDRPAHHRGDVTAPGRLALLRLAVPDVEHPEPAELRGRRIPAEVRQIQLRGLGAPQPPPVDHLEQRRVPVGGQRALPPGSGCPFHLVVGVVQEPLQLLAGERPGFGIALVVVEMSDRVPLMGDRHRMLPGAERLLARQRPAVPAIDQELAELPERALIAADRRWRQVLLCSQRQRPLVHVPRRPRPRVLVRELQEPPHQPFPGSHRVLPQPARHLLRTPAPQHRLDHRVLRAQLRHPGHQLQVRRTRQIRPPHPTPEHPETATT